jgi:very-short-patch-repair endonuclease
VQYARAREKELGKMMIRSSAALTSHSRRLTKLEFARRLRKKANPAERRCWQLIRRQRFGARFRRQAVIYGYIVDFWCPRLRIVIEVDGPHAIDHEREQNLISFGVRILHLPADLSEQSMRIEIENFITMAS